jgi:ABC-type multidrug transport system ATPase subunit
LSLTSPLRVDSVGVSIGGHRILHDVDLTLHPGEMCALIGPSGAGKSTLIRALLGLREPEDGSVKIGTTPMADVGPVGYVPQDDALHRGLTVQRELSYAAELRMPETSEEEREARIAEVLEQVGLSDRVDVRIRRLSGGQRKRVAVALELLTGPPLVILDEPTSGLDPGLEARTMNLLSDVAHTGRIVMVATHAMESIELAEALCVLVGGHLAFFGPPREALTYFRVDRYAGLFGQLGKQSPSAWHLTASADPDQQRFLRRPGPVSRATTDPANGEDESSGADDALERLKDRLESGGAP